MMEGRPFHRRKRLILGNRRGGLWKLDKLKVIVVVVIVVRGVNALRVTALRSRRGGGGNKPDRLLALFIFSTHELFYSNEMVD